MLGEQRPGDARSRADRAAPVRALLLPGDDEVCRGQRGEHAGNGLPQRHPPDSTVRSGPSNHELHCPRRWRISTPMRCAITSTTARRHRRIPRESPTRISRIWTRTRTATSWVATTASGSSIRPRPTWSTPITDRGCLRRPGRRPRARLERQLPRCSNPGQEDCDKDGIGNACDTDCTCCVQ